MSVLEYICIGWIIGHSITQLLRPEMLPGHHRWFIKLLKKKDEAASLPGPILTMPLSLECLQALAAFAAGIVFVIDNPMLCLFCVLYLCRIAPLAQFIIILSVELYLVPVYRSSVQMLKTKIGCECSYKSVEDYGYQKNLAVLAILATIGRIAAMGCILAKEILTLVSQ